MSSKSTRRALSFIISVLITIGSILLVGTQLINNTLCSQSYMNKVFSSDCVKSKCTENFMTNIEALSAQSGIPARVFQAALNNEYIFRETAVDKLFLGNDASLFSNDKIELFENLCIEYLDGNSIEYNEDDIHTTAVKAARIFADSYGFKETQFLNTFISKVKNMSPKFVSSGALIISIGIILIIMLYAKRMDIVRNFCYSFVTAGFAFMFIGAAGLIFRVWNKLQISPQFYCDAIGRVVITDFVAILVIGVLIICICYTKLYFQYKKELKSYMH